MLSLSADRSRLGPIALITARGWVPSTRSSGACAHVCADCIQP